MILKSSNPDLRHLMPTDTVPAQWITQNSNPITATSTTNVQPPNDLRKGSKEENQMVQLKFTNILVENPKENRIKIKDFFIDLSKINNKDHSLEPHILGSPN